MSDSFRDRQDAGKRLGEALKERRVGAATVLAIPRGGVPVAVEVADVLGVPLDLAVTRKIPVPFNTEAGYGAVAEDGTVFLNERMVRALALRQSDIEAGTQAVLEEIGRRSSLYRKILPVQTVKDRAAIIVDDGLASSGFTMVAAIKSVRQRGAKRTIVASPVASGEAYDMLEPIADEIVCLVISRSYPFAVASFYDNWYDLDDDEVMKYLRDWQRKTLTRN